MCQIESLGQIYILFDDFKLFIVFILYLYKMTQLQNFLSQYMFILMCQFT